MLSLAGNLYARIWLGFGVRDSTSGFRAYRTSALRSEELGSLRSEGYSFQIEMTRRMFRAGRTIVEVPITFVERARGKSKMSRRIVVEAMVGVTRWGLSDRLRRDRTRAAR
jgi:dolichol-phosphate mannosyltransferase